jgi:hypothetical protein
MHFTVLLGDPATPADEADVRLRLDLTDVRRKDDLSDYGGELENVVSMRITDRSNSPDPATEPFDDAGTVSDIRFAFTVPCSSTSDTTVGATCSIVTTADAVMPGIVSEGKRAIWELRQVQVFDGGGDGLVSTQTGNTLFADQGIFAP